MNTMLKEYKEYVKKTGNRLDLYRKVVKKYNIKSALYPGSYIDIDPSLVIEKVTYIDNFKGAIKFFKNNALEINDYLNKNKEYSTECVYLFIGEDYKKPLEIEKVDLIISQYAGFVSQATKNYLKEDGILLSNDSHGDATLANFDNDFELIGVIESNNTIKESNLESFFKLPKDKIIDLDLVKKNMKGFKYTKNPSNYIFRKKS